MTLELDGQIIETAWWGPPPDQAPTLVLLHEGLGCVALWRGFPERLAAATGCGVFAYSRFGYGQSAPAALPRPLTYMHEEAEDVLPRILDAAGIRRAVLVGHSDGASIAALYAGSRQDFRIAGLVLIAPHFFVEDVTVASIEAARIAYRDSDLRARLGRYHADPDNAFRGWNDVWLDPAFRAIHPRPRPADTGRRRRVRHARPARPDARGGLLPGRGAGSRGRTALSAPRRQRARCHCDPSLRKTAGSAT